jgi:hypothetical protein
MNRKIPTKWGPELRFAVQPVTPLPFRATQDNALEQLKDGMLKEKLAETFNPQLNSLYRRAANEAASLAWDSQAPLLVFPELFEEKVWFARQQFARQQSIRMRSSRLVA